MLVAKMKVALLLALVSLPAWAARPVSKESLSAALRRGGLAAAQLEEIVRQTGVDFALSPADEQALQSAGASAGLLKAVKETRLSENARSSAGRPLTAMELTVKLFHGNPTTAAAALKTRGAAFDLTMPVEKQLVEAGADPALLALAVLRRLPILPVAAPISGPAQPETPTATASPAVPAVETARPVRVDAGTQSRKLVRRAEAAYPVMAMRARMSGQVVVEVLVGRNGRVRRARVVRGDEIFHEAALSAVREYVYKPTLLDENPIEVISEVAVEFDPSQQAASRSGN